MPTEHLAIETGLVTRETSAISPSWNAPITSHATQVNGHGVLLLLVQKQQFSILRPQIVPERGGDRNPQWSSSAWFWSSFRWIPMMPRFCP